MQIQMQFYLVFTCSSGDIDVKAMVLVLTSLIIFVRNNDKRFGEMFGLGMYNFECYMWSSYQVLWIRDNWLIIVYGHFVLFESLSIKYIFADSKRICKNDTWFDV